MDLSKEVRLKKGFTLMELLLVIALIGIVSGLTIPILISYQKKAILASDTFSVAESIRRAQTLARSSAEDDAWSARIDGASMVIYKGTNYGTRDNSFDEPTSISVSLSTSGVTEFNFEKLSGITADVGTLIIANDDEQKGVSVNEKGLVTY